MQRHIGKHDAGMPQTLLAADEILDVKFFIALICKRNILNYSGTYNKKRLKFVILKDTS